MIIYFPFSPSEYLCISFFELWVTEAVFYWIFIFQVNEIVKELGKRISVPDLISRASCYTLFHKIFALSPTSLELHFRFYFTFLGIISSNLNSAKAERHVIFHILQRLKQYFTRFTDEIKVFPSFSISQRTCRNWTYLDMENLYYTFCRVYKKFYSLFITLVHS